MEKKETNEKFKSNFRGVFQDCKPILIELGIQAVKGVILGFSMRLGVSFFDRSFGKSNLKIYLLDPHRKT